MFEKFSDKYLNESVNEAKSVKVGDFIKTEYGYYYKRVAGKVGGREAFVEIMNGKEGKRKTSLHDSTKFEIVDPPNDLHEAAIDVKKIDKLRKHAKKYGFKEIKDPKDWVKKNGYNEDRIETLALFVDPTDKTNKTYVSVYSDSGSYDPSELEVNFFVRGGGSGNDSIDDWTKEKYWKEYFSDTDESVNEAAYKKGQRIEYQLEYKGGVGKYADSISKSKNVETGVIKKRTKNKITGDFKYELTNGLELSPYEILGLAESKGTFVKFSDVYLNEARGAKVTQFTKPGNDGDIYFSKREGNAIAVRDGDKLQSIYVYDGEVKLGKIHKTDKRWDNMGAPSEKLLVDLKLKNVGGLNTRETQTEDGKLIYKFLSESVNEGRYGKELTKIFGYDFPFDYTEKGNKIVIDPEGYNDDGTLFNMKDDWKEKIIKTIQMKKKKWHASPNMGGGITIHTESVNEGKMPDKYVGNDEIVYLKTKEDSKGANYNLYYKGHDIDAGGRRFSSEKELKDFAANYILSNQLYNKLKYEKPKPLPESVNEEREFGMFNGDMGKPTKLDKEVLDIALKGLPSKITKNIKEVEGSGAYKSVAISPPTVSNKGQSRGEIEYTTIYIYLDKPMGRNKVEGITVGLRKRTSGPGTGYLYMSVKPDQHHSFGPDAEGAIEFIDDPSYFLQKLYNQKFKNWF